MGLARGHCYVTAQKWQKETAWIILTTLWKEQEVGNKTIGCNVKGKWLLVGSCDVAWCVTGNLYSYSSTKQSGFLLHNSHLPMLIIYLLISSTSCSFYLFLVKLNVLEQTAEKTVGTFHHCYSSCKQSNLSFSSLSWSVFSTSNPRNCRLLSPYWRAVVAWALGLKWLWVFDWKVRMQALALPLLCPWARFSTLSAPGRLSMGIPCPFTLNF